MCPFTVIFQLMLLSMGKESRGEDTAAEQSQPDLGRKFSCLFLNFYFKLTFQSIVCILMRPPHLMYCISICYFTWKLASN